MKCKKCGYDLNSEDKICPGCEADLELDRINQEKIQKTGRMVNGIIILLLALSTILLVMKALKVF